MDGLAENFSIHTTNTCLYQTMSVPPTCYLDTDYSPRFVILTKQATVLPMQYSRYWNIKYIKRVYKKCFADTHGSSSFLTSRRGHFAKAFRSH